MKAITIIKVLIFSVLLWLPVLLFTLTSMLLKPVYDQIIWEGCSTESGLYQMTGTNAFAGRVSESGQKFWLARANPPAQSPKTTSQVYNYLCDKEVLLSADSHETNVLRTVDVHTEFLRGNLSEAFKEASDKITDQQENSSRQVLDLLFGDSTKTVKGIIPSQLPAAFQPPMCSIWFWTPIRCFKRKLLSPINAGYMRQVTLFRVQVASQLEQSISDGNNLKEQVNYQTNRFIENELEKYQANTKSGIKFAFLLFWLGGVIGLIVLISFAIKMYLYILARLVFANGVGEQALQLSDSQSIQNKILAENITITGKKCGFSMNLGGMCWYASFTGSIRASLNTKVFWRRVSEAFLARLLTGKLSLHRYTPQKHELIEGYGDNNHLFYLITLKPGDELCFHFESLVAFSEGIHFKRHFNPKLSAFLQYQIFFSIAVGQGMLIIKADGGSAEIIDTTAKGGTVDPLDILAFDYSGSFSSFAETDVLSTYTRSPTIKPLGNTLAIMHSPSRVSHSAWLRIRKIIFFFLPF